MTQQRYVGRNGYATRWQTIDVWVPHPSRATRLKLGDDYTVEFREARAVAEQQTRKP